MAWDLGNPFQMRTMVLEYLPTKLGHDWGFYVGKYSIHGASGHGKPPQICDGQGTQSHVGWENNNMPQNEEVDPEII